MKKNKDIKKNTKENKLKNNPVPSWDEYFISMAHFASTKSKDQSTHVGAIIVGKNKEVISTGMNGFVRGLNDNIKERQERPEKYFWMEHAERNAIYNAARNGSKLDGTKIYITAMSCMDCARAIVQSGIKEVIIDQNKDFENRNEWNESMEKAIQLYKETGVKLRYFNGKYIKTYKLTRGKKEEL